jgi:hypothetical protein
LAQLAVVAVYFLIFAVRLNGMPGKWIKHRCGLRQSDPLSPFLFILAIDTPQHVLRTATQKGLLSLYADDAVVFLNPIKDDVDTFMTIIERFGDATDVRINISKSIVAPIRCDSIDLQMVLQNFSGE